MTHPSSTRQTGPLRRRLARLTVGVVALLAASLLAACQSPSPGSEGSGTTATIGLTYIPNIQFAPFYLADHDSLWGASSVNLRHHGASEGLFTALTNGEEQFVVAGGDEILQARGQGLDLVAVASYYGSYPARLIVPQGSPIASVADLKGHSVGLPGRFGENWFALLVALDQAGLSQDDVTVTEIGYTQQAALATGKVDAVVGFANSDLLSFAAAGFPVEAIDPQVPLVSICLATTRAYAEAHPDTVAVVIAGMRQGMALARDDPAGTLEAAADYIPSFRGETLETAKQVLPATTALFAGPDGRLSPPFDPAQWEGMAQAMAAVGLIPPDTSVTAAYDNSYSSAG